MDPFLNAGLLSKTREQRSHIPGQKRLPLKRTEHLLTGQSTAILEPPVHYGPSWGVQCDHAGLPSLAPANPQQPILQVPWFEVEGFRDTEAGPPEHDDQCPIPPASWTAWGTLVEQRLDLLTCKRFGWILLALPRHGCDSGCNRATVPLILKVVLY
jgi:hypothetical protein